MPPPVADLSDDESTGESIPYEDVEDKKNGDKEMSDAEEEEEDLYVVEKILGHSFKPDGTLMFQVKWQGYDDPKDQTLEPEENLEGAQDVLDEYFKIVGGRPEKPKKRKSMGRPPKAAQDQNPGPKRRRRSRADTEPEPAQPAEENDKDSSMPDWVPKSKSWEKEVKAVDTIVREKDGGLVAFLHWNNDKKSKVSIETCYEKCPRAMLKFYEQHLVFKDS